MDFKEEIMNKAESIKKDTAPSSKGSSKKKQKEEKTQPEAKKQASYPICLLRASEIECRVGKVSENGVSLLLYKDARVDQKILDETFGMFGWKRSHQLLDGKPYCTMAVYDGKTGQWIDKQDVGIAGFSEKEKAQAPESRAYNLEAYGNSKGRHLSANKLMVLTQEMERTGIDLEQIQERYVFDEVDTMPEAVYRKIMSALSKTPDAHVA